MSLDQVVTVSRPSSDGSCKECTMLLMYKQGTKNIFPSILLHTAKAGSGLIPHYLTQNSAPGHIKH